MGKAALALLAAWVILISGSAKADDAIRCTVILDEKSGAAIHREGACAEGFYPQSTFKLPLALMGYDAGILADAHNPRWKYQQKFSGPQRVRKDVDPTIWEQDSIVWYSQEITRKLGRKAFADYVNGFNYGNRDVSGTPGKSDGLTQAWLMSSLKISADQQADLIRRFLTGKLPVSASAVNNTLEIIPRFSASGGWTLQGKTGSGWLRDKSGKVDYNRPLGWFVGWAVKEDRRVVFARLLVDTKPQAKTPISFIVRDSLIADLPGLAGSR